jgi:hypothetical protein
MKERYGISYISQSREEVIANQYTNECRLDASVFSKQDLEGIVLTTSAS